MANPTGCKTKYAKEPLPGARWETVTFAGRSLEAHGDVRPREMVALVLNGTGTELGLRMAAVMIGGGCLNGARRRLFWGI